MQKGNNQQFPPLNSFLPRIVSSVQLPKKNSFHGNYSRKYGNLIKTQFVLANLINYFWQVFCNSKPLCSSDGRFRPCTAACSVKEQAVASLYQAVQLSERSLSRTLLLASFFFYLSILTEAVGPVCFNTADRKKRLFCAFFSFFFFIQ